MKKGGGKSGTSGGSGGEGSPAAKSKIPKLLKTSPTASPTIQRKTTTQNVHQHRSSGPIIVKPVAKPQSDKTSSSGAKGYRSDTSEGVTQRLQSLGSPIKARRDTGSTSAGSSLPKYVAGSTKDVKRPHKSHRCDPPDPKVIADQTEHQEKSASK